MIVADSVQAEINPYLKTRLHIRSILISFLQASMDLPPDKAKLLKQYDDERKWDIICDQVC